MTILRSVYKCTSCDTEVDVKEVTCGKCSGEEEKILPNLWRSITRGGETGKSIIGFNGERLIFATDRKTARVFLAANGCKRWAFEDRFFEATGIVK